MQRDASIAALNEQIVQLTALATRQTPTDPTDLEAEISKLRDKLADTDQRVALHTSRREAAEQRALQEQGAALALRKSHDQTLALLKLVQSECDALERATVDAADSHGAGTRQASLDSVRGKRIVYVGGRPGSNAALKRLVEAAGGDFVVHDGGVEDRKGLLAAALPGADIVVFPVDCVDHDSMNTLKRVCERHQIDYLPAAHGERGELRRIGGPPAPRASCPVGQSAALGVLPAPRLSSTGQPSTAQERISLVNSAICFAQLRCASTSTSRYRRIMFSPTGVSVQPPPL